MNAIVSPRIKPVVHAPGPRNRKPSLDPMAILRLYLVLLVCSPSIYVIGPLGAEGTPAGLLGCIMLILWLLERVARTQPCLKHNPLNWAVAAFAVAMLLSFCAAMTRPAAITEVTAAQRGLISVASWLGVILYVSDSMRTRARLEAFLRFAVLMGAVLATMGIIQFIWNVDFISLLHLPGLTQNSVAGGVYERSGYVRVAGTATHSIEFSAVLGMILPASIYFALNERHRRLWQWGQVALIVAALPLTVARSGVIALALGLVFACIVMRPAQRLLLLLLIPVVGVVFRGALPGFLGVLRDLFMNAGGDSSVEARVTDYAAAWHYFTEAPLFGRGLFTFLPTVYRTFDNQYLATLVEAGVVGLASLVALILVPIFISIRVAAVSQSFRLMAASITAGLVISAVLFCTFDAMGFPMAAGMFCVVAGAAGGLWRNFHGEREEFLTDPPGLGDGKPGAIRKIILGSVLVLIAGIGTVNVLHAHEVYEAKVVFVVRVGDHDAPNVYDQRGSTFAVPNILSHIMASQQITDKLAEQGVTYYTTAIGTGSLAPYTDVLGSGDLMSFSTRSTSGAGAKRNAEVVLATIGNELTRLQDSLSASPQPRIVLADIKLPDLYPVPVHISTALVGYLLLCSLVWQLGLDWSRSRRRTSVPANGWKSS